MEFVETVKVMDPDSGRMCQVHLTNEEVTAILTIGVTSLLRAGMASFTQQKDGVDMTLMDTSDKTLN